MEALLGVEQELKYRLGLRAATFLKQNPAEKISTYSNIKKLYDMRSDLVHGSKSVKDRDFLAKVQKEIPFLEELIRKVIVQLIKLDKDNKLNKKFYKEFEDKYILDKIKNDK